VAWAEALGLSAAVELLQATLDEEKAADEKLSALAEGGINQRAVEGSTGDSDSDHDKPPAPRKRKAAKKKVAPR
jgi:hypothetical protein